MTSTTRFRPREINTIPARSGVAVPLVTDQTIQIINTHGTQVIDLWAFSSSTLTEHLSMSHTRGTTMHLTPLVGDILTTNRRQPILHLLHDTTPGIHDTLMPACDLERYRQLTSNPASTSPDYYHDNCTDNCVNALKRDVNQLFPEGMRVPDPLNLFMNIPGTPSAAKQGLGNMLAGATLGFDQTVSKAGQGVTFKALMDCVVVLSACPQDLVKINAMSPTDAAFVVDGERMI